MTEERRRSDEGIHPTGVGRTPQQTIASKEGRLEVFPLAWKQRCVLLRCDLSDSDITQCLLHKEAVCSADNRAELDIIKAMWFVEHELN